MNEGIQLSQEIKDYFKRLGKKGGNATKEKYGVEYYSRISKNKNRKRGQ